MTILHEDKDLLVVVKPSGLLTVGTARDKSRTAHYLLNDYVRKGDPKSRNRVYVVHRLDQDTSGILLFAKSEKAKQFLQEHWDGTDKYYLAIVHGRLTTPEGKISTYLAENKAHNVYSTGDAAKGKLSHTEYRVLQETKAKQPGGSSSTHRPQTPDPCAFRRAGSPCFGRPEVRHHRSGRETTRSACPHDQLPSPF